MELIVATALMSILLVGIMSFLVTTITNNAVRGARADLLREAQLSLDVMVKDIRLSAHAFEANNIDDDNSPNAATTNGLGWESDADTLVLATAAENTSGNILFSDPAHYLTLKNNIIYYVSDSTLYKRTLAADNPNNRAVTSCPPDEATGSCPADRLSVANVDSLTFRYFDGENNEVSPSLARSVETTLSLQTERYGREVDVTYSTRTVFRNE